MLSNKLLGPMARLPQNTSTTRQMSILNSDRGKLATTGYHKINLLITGLAPISFALSPSPLSIPVDLALGVFLPLHAHIGMNYVITDYVPKLSKAAVGPSRVFMLTLTTLTLLGCLKLNTTGKGLTETVKGLWRGSPVAAVGDSSIKSEVSVAQAGSYSGIKARVTKAKENGQETHAQVQRRLTTRMTKEKRP